MDNNGAPYVAESDTSRARAQREDANGTTGYRRAGILALLDDEGVYGAIWAELAKRTGYHHGQISGALSKLHEMGHVFQLRQTRNGCHPYVHRNYRKHYLDEEVNDAPVKTRASRRVEALETVAQAAHDLCHAQAANTAAAWNALRAALHELAEYEQ